MCSGSVPWNTFIIPVDTNGKGQPPSWCCNSSYYHCLLITILSLSYWAVRKKHLFFTFMSLLIPLQKKFPKLSRQFIHLSICALWPRNLIVLIQINYLVLSTSLGFFTGWVKKGKVEKKKRLWLASMLYWNSSSYFWANGRFSSEALHWFPQSRENVDLIPR